jgi:hypothetical protein
MRKAIAQAKRAARNHRSRLERGAYVEITGSSDVSGECRAIAVIISALRCSSSMNYELHRWFQLDICACVCYIETESDVLSHTSFGVGAIGH